MRAAYLILIALSLTAVCWAYKDVISLGSPDYKGVLLAKETLARKFNLLNKVRALFVFRTKTDGVIKRIVANNNKHNGASVKILEGGIDHNFVKIELVSARNRGFNFTISIFGQYEDIKD